MLKSKALRAEDLYTVDWSKFDCHAVLNEATGHLQIVCDIKPEHPHTEALGGGSPKRQNGREEWNTMIGI